MLQPIRSLCLLVAGVIHLLPLTGVLGAERLSALYGLDFGDPSLRILMQHRAVLFGLLGVLLIAAIVRPELRPMAISAGLLSAVSFLVIAYLVGGYNAALQRVVVADWVAVFCLVVAAGTSIVERRR